MYKNSNEESNSFMFYNMNLITQKDINKLQFLLLNINNIHKLRIGMECRMKQSGDSFLNSGFIVQHVS